MTEIRVIVTGPEEAYVVPGRIEPGGSRCGALSADANQGVATVVERMRGARRDRPNASHQL